MLTFSISLVLYNLQKLCCSTGCSKVYWNWSQMLQPIPPISKLHLHNINGIFGIYVIWGSCLLSCCIILPRLFSIWVFSFLICKGKKKSMTQEKLLKTWKKGKKLGLMSFPYHTEKVFKKFWLLSVWLDPSLNYWKCRIFFKSCYVQIYLGTLGNLVDSILKLLAFTDQILAFYSKLKPKVLAIMIWIWLILQALATLFCPRNM